jgi:hypothetical protein
MRNDYKSLMDEIEKRLHARFASLIEDPTEGAQQEQQPASAAAEDVPRDAPPQRLDPVFAKVDSVVDGSPAAAAGLRVGDEIRNFGYVSRANNDGLKRVAECVQGNEDVSVRLTLLGGRSCCLHICRWEDGWARPTEEARLERPRLRRARLRRPRLCPLVLTNWLAPAGLHHSTTSLSRFAVGLAPKEAPQRRPS